ncbi:hypothetical protein PPL_12640 [Heterostelium album PN500]|uniref:NrS-1 polymerase-like helicase domain-containing protein n=1 Tax=Heterostelium pallidum (strain ATCC 26659 / Pp 5 / PN500) TaxID=670386 RepID=D3BN62_HETP5|nr:hypothetical protein PPL_12640 [Heterostelium album PN500]EFA77424.1 hypothetical protein PPL_12640 [Heterostelium album PN500]|eukprot:XP_020429553.1 hypothetical protein PPL_12640 [Heterostelium album PN500]
MDTEKVVELFKNFIEQNREILNPIPVQEEKITHTIVEKNYDWNNIVDNYEINDTNERLESINVKAEVDQERQGLFGQCNTVFDRSKLREMIHTAKAKNDIKEVKKYIKTHFMKLQNGSKHMMWSPTENCSNYLTKQEIIDKHLIKDLKNNKFYFSASDWFFEEDDEFYISGMNPNKPLYYTQNGANMFNLFAGYKWTDRNSFNVKMNEPEYAARMKLSIGVILNHIRKVWCSDNQDQFDFVKYWITSVIAGRRPKLAIYLQSGQGTGKSIIIDFIRDHVLGESIVFQSQDPSIVQPGSFNGPLAGKILISLEDLPTSSAGEWNKTSNSIKHLITGSNIVINDKFKTQVTIDNHLSFIITSNTSAIKIEDDDRRYAILDVSNIFKNNKDYFEWLAANHLTSAVGEAFYWWCVDNVDLVKQFNRVPDTQTKTDIKSDHLRPPLQFIKENFVLQKNALEMTLKEFYDRLTEYCTNKKISCPTKPQTKKILGEYGIETKEMCRGGVSGKNNWFVYTHDQLLQIYKVNNMISRFDTYEDLSFGELQKIKMLEKENEELEKRK